MIAAMAEGKARVEHVSRVQVRYAETDQMGVVHHGNYVLYLEVARTSLMRDRGCSYGSIERRGFGLPVRKLDLRFRKSAFYEDELVLTTWVQRLGAASVTFQTEIHRASDAAHVATGVIELACVDLAGPVRKPVALPADLRALLGPAAE